MKKWIHILTVALGLLALSSCDYVMKIFFDDEVVARLGNKRVYRSTIEKMIPAGLPAEDSVALVLKYVDSWASELIFSDIAEEQLSKSEQDVSKELDDYRNALLKYRYEQRYINEHLDTAITQEQIRDYYNSHQDVFSLSIPIVKARFLDIMRESPNLELLKNLISSDGEDDIAMADSVAYSSALRYVDNTDKWMEMTALSRMFGTDYGTILSKMNASGLIEVDDGKNDIKIAYVSEIIHSGAVAPMEYCEPQIRDIIISNRKRVLLSDLEQDLLKDALDNKTLIIY